MSGIQCRVKSCEKAIWKMTKNEESLVRSRAFLLPGIDEQNLYILSVK